MSGLGKGKLILDLCIQATSTHPWENQEDISEGVSKIRAGGDSASPCCFAVGTVQVSTSLTCTLLCPGGLFWRRGGDNYSYWRGGACVRVSCGRERVSAGRGEKTHKPPPTRTEWKRNRAGWQTSIDSALWPSEPTTQLLGNRLTS